MNLRLLIILFVFSNFAVYSQGSDPIWDRDFAWGADTADYLMDVIETDKLSVVSGGHSFSSDTLNQINQNFGLSDFWLIEEDVAGNIIWNQIYGGDSSEFFSQIVILNDGYLLVGSSISGISGNKTAVAHGGFDYWVVKVDKNGNKVWDQSYGGSENDILTSAELLNNGNVILGGYSNSGISGNKSEANIGENDYWVLVINPDGNVLWNKTLGGDKDDKMTSIYYKDGIYLGGYSNSDIGGDKTENSYGAYDYWIVFLNQVTGQVEWDVTYGGAGDDFLENMSKNDHASTFYVGGTSNSAAGGNKTTTNQGQNDYWVLSLDSLGNKNWESNVGGIGNDVFTDMVSTPEGAIIIGGYSNSGIGANKLSDNNGGYDYWIVKLDSTGGIYWEKTYGGADDDTLQSIYIRCDRGLFLGGYSLSDVSGDKTYTNQGENDYWVVKLDIPTIPRFLADDHCYGTVMNFRDDSEIWPDVWSWDFGDPASGANSSSDQHPLHQFSAVGTYTITLTIKEGCQGDTTFSKTISVFENLVLDKVDIGRDLELCYGQELKLENKTDNLPPDATFLWTNGETTPTITIDTVGKYYLTVTSGRCYEADTLIVDHCPIIFAPNAFTPNDNGVNDSWGFKGLGIVDFNLFVYDRWGLLVFEAFDIDDWWDGAYNYKEAQIDVYVYKVIYRGINSSEKSKVGTVTLVR